MKRIYLFITFIIVQFLYIGTSYSQEIAKDENYINLAVENFRSSQYDKALKFIDSAIIIVPDNYMSRLVKGAILFNLKKFDKMEIEFAEAKKIAPNEPDVYNVIGGWHREMGLLNQAEKDFDNYEKLGGSDNGVLSNAFYVKCLLRQFEGRNLPPPSWVPDTTIYRKLTFLTGYNLLINLFDSDKDYQKSAIGLNAGKYENGGNFYKFYIYTKESPYQYAPNFFIWDGAVVMDNNYGILICNGTKIKFISTSNDGKEKIQTGIIKNWKIVFSD